MSFGVFPVAVYGWGSVQSTVFGSLDGDLRGGYAGVPSVMVYVVTFRWSYAWTAVG